MVWSEPIPRAAAMQINQQTLQQDLQIISDKVHFIPGSEIENSLNFNTKQTNGVILGAAILLLIILIGVTTGSQQTSTD